MLPSLKSPARWLVRRPGIGAMLTAGLGSVGAVHLGRRVARLNGVAPADVVRERLPSKLFAAPELLMYTVGGRDQVAMSTWLRGWTAFEAPLPEIFSSCVRDGAVVIDIGANTGFYALLAASTGASVQVHAFEPYPPVAELLEANLALCPQGAQVQVVREAISDTPGQTELYIPVDDHGLVEASASLVAEFRSEHSEILRVPVTTLDEYVKRGNLSRVDAMKIDVEGLEDKVLAGARQVLRDLRPVVFLEILDTPQFTADCTKLDRIRREADYLCVRLDPEALVIGEAVELSARARNQALWPRERIQQVHEVAQRADFPVKPA